ncbi:hypothetical protein QOZ80_5BG0442980 [Eleusine coracana subsp. coracana]|nr:hypothetical protein QOZ80_5BG0442980 [Eleusine coracana subsp. coracana]
MEPTELTIQRLHDITDGFSEGRKLGQGAYGKVYRGEDKSGEVAVKLLHNVGPGLKDEEFKNEFDNLKKLKHPNIMKLVGYCYQTQYKCMKYNGKTIFAEHTCRALCLEYLHNGSLQDFLSEGICDGRLDWHTRFKIIKGACEGLKYLHEEFKDPIYHLDLKPDNILLDINMVPKLADFGLSQIFSEEQTRITQNSIGTVGYMPPEYIEKGVISKMFDIYSMGVVMIKTISGLSGRSKSAEMPAQEFINLLHDSWRVKLQEKWSGSSLEAYCQQVKRCTEIALKCVEVERQNRPNIVDIIHELNALQTAADEISHCPGGELLSVYPFQLVFPSVVESSHQMIACPLHLTNNTDDNIQFRLMIPRQRGEYTDVPEFDGRFFIGKLSGRVPPRTKLTGFLTLDTPWSIYRWSALPENGYEFFTLEFWRERHEDEVQQVKLLALYEPPGPGAENKTTTSEILLGKWVQSMDVHPTKPWIMMVGHHVINIHNYETRKYSQLKLLNTQSILQCLLCGDEPCFTLAKFIVRKNWIVAGNSAGGIYVYSYGYPEKIIHHLKQAHSKSVVSLAIHPTEPYVLSASEDGYIKLWDFENEWNVMQVFGHFVFPWQELHVHQHVTFNPKDASIFVSVQDNRIKIWNLRLFECTFTSEHAIHTFKFVPLSMHCLNYFSRGNEVFLIGSFSEGIAKVWDCQSMKWVKTLETPYGGDVRAACSHPDLPMLLTGSDDGTICLWNSTNFKLEGTLSFGLGSVRAIECLKGSRRVVIRHDYGMAITEIGSEQAGVSAEVVV